MAKIHFSAKQPMAGEELETVADPTGHEVQCHRRLTVFTLWAECSCEERGKERGGGRERERLCEGGRCCCQGTAVKSERPSFSARKTIKIH